MAEWNGRAAPLHLKLSQRKHAPVRQQMRHDALKAIIMLAGH